MHHFFVDKSEIIGEEIRLYGENFHHLQKVLRGKIGEEIIISSGETVDYHCRIQGYGEDHAVLSVSFLEEAHELRTKVILLQALPKGEKMELIIQKAVELGVSEMIPLDREGGEEKTTLAGDFGSGGKAVEALCHSCDCSGFDMEGSVFLS